MSITDKLGESAFWDMMESNPALLAKNVCAIDLTDLETTLEKHSALRGWVSAAYETSRVAEERAKWNLTKARARVLLEVKAELDPHTGKGKTVAVVEAEVDLHPEVEATVLAFHDASEKKGALRAMTVGLSDRKDMLIQIAAKQREELK